MSARGDRRRAARTSDRLRQLDEQEAAGILSNKESTRRGQAELKRQIRKCTHASADKEGWCDNCGEHT